MVSEDERGVDWGKLNAREPDTSIISGEVREEASGVEHEMETEEEDGGHRRGGGRYMLREREWQNQIDMYLEPTQHKSHQPRPELKGYVSGRLTSMCRNTMHKPWQAPSENTGCKPCRQNYMP